jgi:hypothetical protein
VVSRRQLGNGLCSWNIDSIVCRQTSLFTCSRCLCQIGVSNRRRNSESNLSNPDMLIGDNESIGPQEMLES